MKYINLLYDDEYEDVDIVLVPDDIADNIGQIMFEFARWCGKPENNYRFMKTMDNGKTYLSIDTEEVLWYFNNVINTDAEKAVIVKQHTSFCPEYPVAEL